jgi:hypothetical protein
MFDNRPASARIGYFLALFLIEGFLTGRMDLMGTMEDMREGTQDRHFPFTMA